MEARRESCAQFGSLKNKKKKIIIQRHEHDLYLLYPFILYIYNTPLLNLLALVLWIWIEDKPLSA